MASKKATTVYVGDSITDLLALLKVDIGTYFFNSNYTGILFLKDGIRDGSSLKTLCDVIGVSVFELSQYREDLQKKALFTCSSWSEIKLFIENFENKDIL